MITQLFPKDFKRYLALPVLGPIIDSYAGWLNEQQYTRRSSRYELRMAAYICKFLKNRGFHRAEDVSENDLQGCYRLFRRKFPREEGSVRVLARFLTEHALLKPSPASELSLKDIHLNAFKAHLQNDRGYAPSTIQRQVHIASEFLDWLSFEEDHDHLRLVRLTDIEGFVRQEGKRMGRVGLQKVTSALRNFLRFLATGGFIPSGLDQQIDTPRVYRQEKLPRALPWITVQAFLHSINRSTAIGKRDYAMFSLMTTYGLRACDIVTLKLEDIKWRAQYIQIHQTKTATPLSLPLTHEVGSAIYAYLKKVPRNSRYRQLFLRLKAPAGPLKSTAVTSAFQSWSQKSGLDIPFKGAHCLRHSYALHLCRRGLSLKIIGDILGHKSPESTAAYIRLNTEDLREVALNLPTPHNGQKEGDHENK